MPTAVASSISYPATVFDIEGIRYTATLLSSASDARYSDAGCQSVLQSRQYHEAMELAPPDQMRFWYVRLEQDAKPVGMLTFQISDFNPGASLQKHAKANLIQKLRYTMASWIQLKVLCLGNTLVTGDYGFCFVPEVSHREQTLLMMHTIDWLLTLQPFKGIHMVFVKDFYHDIFTGLPDSHFCRKYHFIDTQPNMMMDVDPAWRHIDDYLSAIKSKYRIRANAAIKAAAHLERKELSAEEIEQLEPILYQLYLKVASDVGFNLFTLSPQYFSTVKRRLGHRFRLWVYLDKGEVISFFTIFEDGEVLDAHFLGYDPKVNHMYKLYLNMLLAMIDEACQRGFTQLQLSRTATEIKSSVGAVGVPMWAYLRFPNRLLNQILPFVYNFFKPDLSWTPRSPFHE